MDGQLAEDQMAGQLAGTCCQLTRSTGWNLLNCRVNWQGQLLGKSMNWLGQLVYWVIWLPTGRVNWPGEVKIECAKPIT